MAMPLAFLSLVRLARTIAVAFALAMTTWLAPLPAHAVEPDEILADQRLDARARVLSSELRCLV